MTHIQGASAVVANTNGIKIHMGHISSPLDPFIRIMKGVAHPDEGIQTPGLIFTGVQRENDRRSLLPRQRFVNEDRLMMEAKIKHTQA